MLKHPVLPALCVFFLLSFVNICEAGAGKYSKEANQGESNILKLEKPFRMNKVNLLWSKARQRLGDAKLKQLYSELKVHDKEAITWKKLKSDGQDKDGLKEAVLRKKFHDIMDRYNLLKHMDDPRGVDYQPKSFNEPSEESVNKAIFKDKKLNKLWEKAEKSVGFSVDELMMLKQEFQHHQQKLDEYYDLLNDVHAENSTENDAYDNTIENYLNSEGKLRKPVEEKIQSIRDKHVELKDSYEKLKSTSFHGPSGDEFKERRVKMLWKLANEADFTPHELESIKEELDHYEKRITKLNYLEAELSVMQEVHLEKSQDDIKDETKSHLVQKVKHLSHKVDKLHNDIENRIKERHSEL